MTGAGSTWVIISGWVGLAAFAAGGLLVGAPTVDRSLPDVLDDLRRRRTTALAGALTSVTGAALLLWPIAAVATEGTGDAWASLRLFSLASAVSAFAVAGSSAMATAALVWRDPTDVPDSTARLVLDGVHLAVWSVSAPMAIVMTVSTTAVGVQNELFGWTVIAAAGLKVATAVVEIVGIGVRHGWNAGGWAAGSSGYASVLWLAAVLVSLG